MTQREAYLQIHNKIQEITGLVAQCQALADEHEVEFEFDGTLYQVTDPDEDDWESSDEWDDSGC
jgi:hypothetical protein